MGLKREKEFIVVLCPNLFANPAPLSDGFPVAVILQRCRTFRCYTRVRNLLATVAFLAPAFLVAGECPEMVTPKDAALVITEDPDVPIYHIRLPQEVLGLSLKHLALSASQEANGQLDELVLPLEIKQKGSITGSYFYLSSAWAKIKVTGSYGEDMCVELSSELGM